MEDETPPRPFDSGRQAHYARDFSISGKQRVEALVFLTTYRVRQCLLWIDLIIFLVLLLVVLETTAVISDCVGGDPLLVSTLAVTPVLNTVGGF